MVILVNAGFFYLTMRAFGGIFNSRAGDKQKTRNKGPAMKFHAETSKGKFLAYSVKVIGGVYETNNIAESWEFETIAGLTEAVIEAREWIEIPRTVKIIGLENGTLFRLTAIKSV